jgi:hypothetical protein
MSYGFIVYTIWYGNHCNALILSWTWPGFYLLCSSADSRKNKSSYRNGELTAYDYRWDGKTRNDFRPKRR